MLRRVRIEVTNNGPANLPANHYTMLGAQSYCFPFVVPLFVYPIPTNYKQPLYNIIIIYIIIF